MATLHADGTPRAFAHQGPQAAGQHLVKTVATAVQQAVGFFLVPFQSALVAMDAKRQTMLGTRRRIGHPQGAACAVVIVHERCDVVVHRAARARGTHVGKKGLHSQAAHIGAQVEGVGADVQQHQRAAQARRVHAPAGGGRGIGQIALHILQMDLPDGAQLAALHHVARLAHHRVAGVAVGDAELQAGGLHLVRQPLRGRQVGGQRLVADDVKARIQRRHADIEMAVVGRHDGQHIDAVGARRLGLDQVLPGAVAALG